jgi:uncharacterized protein
MSSPTIDWNEQLGIAVIRGDAVAVDSCLNHGADPNAIFRCNTLLNWAGAEGYPLVMRRLLEAGAIATAVGDNGYSALLYAAESDRPDCINLLLDYGAPIAPQNSYKENVLHIVARHGQTEIIQRLLPQVTDVDQRNWIGDTAFYLAVDNGHRYAAKALFDAGADINTTNIGGWSPIMMAAAKAHIDLLEWLIENEANVHLVNSWGSTALSEARKCFRAKEAVSLLQKAGAIE